MLRADQFREIYALLDADQTVDDNGACVDCGVRCGKHCCKPDITKYMLPGERSFLESELRARVDAGDESWRFSTNGFFDTYVGVDHDAPCACQKMRDLRPFNCRVFPYGAKIVDKRVIDLVKGKQAYLEPCWIEVPGPTWRAGALKAWQIVIDDPDCRALFAKLTTLWEWNRALERGEEPGPVLVVLTQLEHIDDDERWARASRFFGRKD